jgi:cell fate regulator YaaT (PSP1 superfamily)
MPIVVGIRFNPVTKMYYFSPGELQDLAEGDPVIVETSQGEELGWVVASSREVSVDEIKGKLKSIVRRAEPTDLALLDSFALKEESALERCREKVAELGLPMKVIKAEYSFDGKRLVFSFVAEERVDFRELVRALARSFKTRIEMRQIGARDEAKLIGGYGPCGRPLCCVSWLTEFHPVSIRMAKQQDLPLTPTEISGLCGRLLCCLAYENDLYAVVKNKMPKVGATVETPQGQGVVRSHNVLTETVTVELQSEIVIEITPEELTVAPSEQNPHPKPKKRRRK